VKGLSVVCVGWGGEGDYLLGLIFIDVEEGCFLLPFLIGYKYYNGAFGIQMGLI
jgi:hypothetical protein